MKTNFVFHDNVQNIPFLIYQKNTYKNHHCTVCHVPENSPFKRDKSHKS
jgi:hypothetical protein